MINKNHSSNCILKLLRKGLIAISIIVVQIFADGKSADAALLPPDFMTAVVALGGNQVVTEDGKSVTKWVTIGTGFLYGYLVKNDDDPTKRRYAVYLITAGHVIRPLLTSQQKTLAIRLDAKDPSGKSEQFDIQLSGWFFHSNLQIDLAATLVPIEFFKSKGLQSGFFENSRHAFGKKKMIETGVSAGDGVFILGFPMNLAGVERNYVILRQGAIARISEYLEGASNSFLLDAFIFPGNSGGPVLLKPEVAAIEGTKSNNQAALIGVVSAYLPYIDTAISSQTKRPRITFEENSGLAQIVPIDYIDEMLKDRAEEVWKREQAQDQLQKSPLLQLPKQPTLQLPLPVK